MKHFLLRAGATAPSASVESIASALVIAVIVIAFLYVGRPILEPLVIATLLAFILSPVIRWLRAWGLWRTPAVVLSVVGALGMIGLLSATIVVQIAQLAEDLPKYETTLREKVRALGAAPLTSSVLDRASGTLRDLQEEITRNPAPKAEPKPLPVEVRQPEPRGLEAIASLLRPLLSPLATTPSSSCSFYSCCSSGRTFETASFALRERPTCSAAPPRWMMQRRGSAASS